MRTSVFLTSVYLGAFASGAFAADVSIKGNVSETVEASDNYFLVNKPSGSTVKSLTGGTLAILARTPTTQYLFDTNFSYYKYFGAGAADANGLTSGKPASATFRIDHTTELAKYNLAASWTRVDIASTLLAQSGTVTAQGTSNTYSVTGGVTRDLSRIDSVSWTANASTVSYIDSNLTPYVDVTTVASWNHNLTQTTTLNNSVTFDWFSEDDPAKSQRLFWKAMTGLESKLSSRLTFNGNVGWIFVNAYQKGGVQSVLPPVPPIPLVPFQPQVGAANGWVADVALYYDLLKTTKVSLTAAQTVAPLLTGQLQKSDTFGLTLNHQINNAANLSLITQFSYLPASSGSSFVSNQTSPSEIFTASAVYGYQLAREWHSTLSYTYRQRNDSAGLAKSNTILLALSRDFTLLGNPAAINKAEEERGRERARQSVGQVFPNFQ